MVEYIEKDKLINSAPRLYAPHQGVAFNNGFDPKDWAIKISDILSFPAADVRENVPPTTNADRIRAMSDEELAEYLESLLDLGTKHWLEWLKSPAEGE